MTIGHLPGPPPGYDQTTWKTLEAPHDGVGDLVLLAEDGHLWVSHAEDEFYWRHWDIFRNGLKVGRYPSDCRRPDCSLSDEVQSGDAGSADETDDGFFVESYEPHKTIRQRREELRFSQAEAAAAIGLGLPAYRDLEDEDADAYFAIRLGVQRRLYAFLGLDMLEVLGYSCAFCGPRSDALPPSAPQAPGEVVRLRREELGLTRDALERRMNWAPGVLQHFEEDHGYLDGTEPASPTVANIQELAWVLKTPVQLLLATTCPRCMNRGIWRDADPHRYDHILDTILVAFDLSTNVGRKQACQECIRYADERWGGTRDYHPFVWAAAVRLQQDRVVCDVFRQHVISGGDEALRLSWQDGTGPVLAGNRAGLRYLHELLGRIAHHATPGEHVHLRDDDILWKGSSFPLTLSLVGQEHFADDDEEDNERTDSGDRDQQPARRDLDPRSIVALVVLHDHILPDLFLTTGKVYRVLDSHPYTEGERVWRLAIRDEIYRMHVFRLRWDDGEKSEIAFDLDDPGLLYLTKEALSQMR